jgi:large exoprotein involved in heme utilization and adhesion
MSFLNPAGVMFGPNAKLDVPASLYVSSADYLIISIASAGESPINLKDFTDNRFAAYGTFSLSDTHITSERLFGNIDASGPGGGAVFIRAGRFFLDGGWLFADTRGQQAGRGITIHANEALTLQDGARITTEVFDFDRTLFGKASGKSERIAIETGDLSFTGGSQIASTSRSSGVAGNISLTARHQFSLTESARKWPSARKRKFLYHPPPTAKAVV